MCILHSFLILAADPKPQQPLKLLYFIGFRSHSLLCLRSLEFPTNCFTMSYNIFSNIKLLYVKVLELGKLPQ